MPKAAEYVPYEGPIVTRAEALGAGKTRYFTGKPCPKGHLSERWVGSYTCDACQRLDQAQRYTENINGRRDKSLAHNHAAYFADVEKSRAYSREYSRATYEQRKPYMQAWRKAHREEHNAYCRERFANASDEERERRRTHVRNRRAKLKAGGTHTPKQIRELLRLQRFRCANCRISIRKGYHADHIIPLSRGGTNDIRNIQLLCQPCNQSKFAKHPLDWAKEQQRLL